MKGVYSGNDEGKDWFWVWRVFGKKENEGDSGWMGNRARVGIGGT